MMRLAGKSVAKQALATSVKASSNSANLAVASLSTAKKSWVPENDEKLQQVTTKALIQEIGDKQREMASQVVPWFLKNMPAAYFRQVPEDLRTQHVQAITALRDIMQSDLSLKIETKTDNTLQVTFINSQTKTGLLRDQIKNLVVPKGYELSNVNVFSSLDGTLALNIFSFDSTSSQRRQATSADAEKLNAFVADVKAGKHANDATVPKYSDLFAPAALADFLKRVRPEYVSNADPRRFMIHRELYEKVRNNDSTVVHMEPFPGDSNQTWITVAAANVIPDVLLRLVSNITSAHRLDIGRAHLDSIATPEISSAELQGSVTLLRLLVTPLDDVNNLNKNAEFAKVVSAELRRAKWLDDQTTGLGLSKHPQLGLDRAEVITALCSMLHGPLYKIDANSFSSIKSILQLVEGNRKHADIAGTIAQLFLERFNPANPLGEKDFQVRSADIRRAITAVPSDSAKTLLNKMLDAVQSTLRTNFYNADRYALSLRVDPMIMMPQGGPTAEKPLPFGVFFIHGRNFNGFHNRFRDIARGGLRVVTPQNSDQYALESTRQYDEVYGLSYAQQLKNKDIPEGGSKGVILVNSPVLKEDQKFFAMRKSVKAFSDAMLDLIVKDSVSKLVDFYKKDELIYLGPDEQIIPSDIEWIITRAGQRGYPIPAAFMSSKAEDGFNHKEFGVTSEGVNVYLEVALKQSLNIDPKKQPFTVKITGGPDGDVAGNLIRILFRDYGKNAKVVAVADGFGVAEDPNGLDPQELLRLVTESKSIDNFNKGKLSKDGKVLSASTDEGFHRRNDMHFRIKSDVFVPAGGRPNTINADNWRQYLGADGKPSSPVIVEGANLFLTKEARQLLFDNAKVQIVKDSSANKCGVVTSSCEVMASMLLTKQEFMAIKPQLVEDVLEKLRYLARAEGELLFREFRNYPGSLPRFSERISFAIAKVTDAITDALANVQPSDPLFKELLPLVKENLPKKLAEVAGDRIPAKFPLQYQKNAIASTLASMLVYKEGIHLVETQPDEKIAERAFMYYRAHQNIGKIIAELEAEQNTPGAAGKHKSVIVDILKRGGARTSLNIF